MDTSPLVPDYARASHSRRRIPPAPVVSHLWYLCMVVAMAISLLCLIIEFENAHFQTFSFAKFAALGPRTTGRGNPDDDSRHIDRDKNPIAWSQRWGLHIRTNLP